MSLIGLDDLAALVKEATTGTAPEAIVDEAPEVGTVSEQFELSGFMARSKESTDE